MIFASFFPLSLSSYISVDPASTIPSLLIQTTIPFTCLIQAKQPPSPINCLLFQGWLHNKTKKKHKSRKKNSRYVLGIASVLPKKKADTRRRCAQLTFTKSLPRKIGRLLTCNRILYCHTRILSHLHCKAVHTYYFISKTKTPTTPTSTSCSTGFIPSTSSSSTTP